MPFTGENSLVWNGECFLAAKKDNNPIVNKVNKQGEILGQNRINSGIYLLICYAKTIPMGSYGPGTIMDIFRN
jgi:hypothetical protein